MEFEGSKSAMTPEGVYIIGTYDEDGVPNAMNAAWGVQSGYSQITFFLGKHKTTQNLQATGAFTVAFGTADTVAISDYFGIDSGTKVNKIEKAGVHVQGAACERSRDRGVPGHDGVHGRQLRPQHGNPGRGCGERDRGRLRDHRRAC